MTETEHAPDLTPEHIAEVIDVAATELQSTPTPGMYIAGVRMAAQLVRDWAEARRRGALGPTPAPFLPASLDGIAVHLDTIGVPWTLTVSRDSDDRWSASTESGGWRPGVQLAEEFAAGRSLATVVEQLAALIGTAP
jgi:hypothetical protein